jgi:hypothetical protein
MLRFNQEKLKAHSETNTKLKATHKTIKLSSAAKTVRSDE